MSSFDTLEKSVQDSRPIEVYTIQLGGQAFRYTSAEDVITVGLNEYEPISIQRSAIGQGVEERRRIVTITLPADNVFARKYINVVPGQKATVDVVRLQRDESPTFNTQVLIFRGQVLSVRFPDDGLVAEIATRTIEASASQSIPRFTAMASCNHVLFGPGCNVDPATFSNTGTVTVVSGNQITVPGLNVRPDQYFRGGTCTPTSETDPRLVIDHVGNVLTLLLPFSSSILGGTVEVRAGCDHKFDGDCATKFDNVIEFGGRPYVPTKNPFDTGLA
jgi:uncharacterized phage protein (TIGR02218 family)